MKARAYIIIAAILVSLTALITLRPDSVEDRIRKFEKSLSASVISNNTSLWTLEERMKHYKVPALSIAVIKDYKIEWAKAYGMADVALKKPATPQTLFQAASISKSLNAVGVLKLAQAKRIKLDSDINNYLESWKFPYDNLSYRKITVTNLLTHTGGLNVHGFAGYAQNDNTPNIKETLDGLTPSNNEPVRVVIDPDYTYQYSGGGTTISQLIVQDVTGRSYDQYMRAEILGPMGMSTSFYSNRTGNKDAAQLLTTGYDANGNEVDGKYRIYPEQAAAGLWTNPTELANFVIEMQQSLKGNSNKILSKELTEFMLTPYMDNVGPGVFIESKAGEKYFQHSGGNEGFRCQYWGSMENGNGVVVMINSNNGALINEVITSVGNVYGWKAFQAEVADVVLSEAQLKSLEGYYNFVTDDKFHLQVLIKDNKLTLRELWSGRELKFLPKSELEFSGAGFTFELKFKKDEKGNVTELLALGKDVWMKDDYFKPIERTVMALEPSALKKYEGEYALKSNKNLIAQVTARRDHLFIKQLWDNTEHTFVPESETVFFVKDNPYFHIKFQKHKSGEITQFIALGNEVLEKVK